MSMQIATGRTLITVKSADRSKDASDVVRKRRGYDYETRKDRKAS